MNKMLANHEIVTLAVYLLGGESQSIDPEDIAVKANEIAPGRFTWRKYPDQISIDNVRKRLWDARKLEKGGYLVGSDRKGWQLTEQGLEFAQQCIGEVEGATLARKPIDLKERQWLRGERIRMLASEAYAKFQTGGMEVVTMQEANTFFRLDDYVMGQARERKILRVVNNFATDNELGRAVTELAAKVRKG
jgi:hypothetical protein